MFFDIQKASMTKRISALLLDIILLAIAATGFGFLVSVAVGYDAKYDELEAYYDKYESDYGISLHMTGEEIGALPPEEVEKYLSATSAMNTDEALNRLYVRVVNLTLVIQSLGILLGYMVTEFTVPMIFGNGQTVGKKIFGLGLMQKNQTKLKPFALAVRTVLGKYAVETMIPVFMIVMLLGNMTGVAATIVIGLLLLIQLAVLIRTPTNSAIHDIFADTVVVDIKSQKIFDDIKAKEEYKIRMEKGNL